MLGFGQAPVASSGKTAPSPGFGATGGATAGGFGATGGATAGGFGATGGATAGGFGATGGATAGGFGATGGATAGGFGAFGASKGFGGSSVIGSQPQVPPYKGIKGPGFSTDWSCSVNFSTLRDDVLFEELPLPLQQHLMELHNFIQAEHDASRFVDAFLTDSLGTSSGASSTYRDMQKKLNHLMAGANAVDSIRVDCFEREVQTQQLGQLLEKCEEDVVQYSKRVWEPLADQDFTQRRSGFRSDSPSEVFQHCLCDIQARMGEISAAVAELELAVLPAGQRQKGISAADGNSINSAAEPPPSAALLSRYASGVEQPEATAGVGSALPTHPVLQMNMNLSNELTILLNLAAWVSRLHERADGARDLFSHLYGASEAEVLLAQQQRQLPTEPKRPFALRPTAATFLSDISHNTIGDIHRRSVGLDRLGALGNEERRMQYDVLLERQLQGSAPATVPVTKSGLGAATPNAGAGVGGAGVFGTASSASIFGKGLNKKNGGG